MNLGRLNHVGVATPSIEKSVALYRDMLGATKIHEPFDLPPQGVRVCFVDTPNSQIELIEPTVVVTLGRYATGLLRGEMAPLGAVRGRVEVRVLGSRAVRLLPVLHPAAALYRREPTH